MRPQEDELAMMCKQPPWYSTAHPDMQKLYDYWVSKRGKRSMPARCDIDPVDLPPALLPYILIVDVVPDERRFIYRLVGTREVEIRGQDPTGHSILETFLGPSPQLVLSRYQAVLESGMALFDNESLSLTDERFEDEQTLFLPMSDNGIDVNKILVLAKTKRLSW